MSGIGGRSQHFPFRQSEEDHEHPGLREQFTLAAHDLADHNQLPKGILDYAQVTSGQSNISSETDITGLSVTVEVDSDRLIRISGLVRMETDNLGRTVCRIKEDGSEIGVIGDHLSSGSNSREVFAGGIVSDPSGGSHTYKLTLENLSMGSTTNIEASSSAPNEILVEDIGPA